MANVAEVKQAVTDAIGSETGEQLGVAKEQIEGLDVGGVVKSVQAAIEGLRTLVDDSRRVPLEQANTSSQNAKGALDSNAKGTDNDALIGMCEAYGMVVEKVADTHAALARFGASLEGQVGVLEGVLSVVTIEGLGLQGRAIEQINNGMSELNAGNVSGKTYLSTI